MKYIHDKLSAVLAMLVFWISTGTVLYLHDKPVNVVRIHPVSAEKIVAENLPKLPTTKELKLTKAITSIYKHINHQEAVRVVQLTFKHAKKHNISPTLALGLIAAESSFKNNAVSSVGAMGYTQVYPKYHREKIKNRDLFKAPVAIEVGMQILSDCINRRESIKSALACYNGATTDDSIERYYEKVMKRKEQILQLAAL